MKVELSNKAKTNLKAITLTALVVFIVIFLFTMLLKHTAEFVAIVIMLVILAFVGYFIFVTFMSIRDMIVEYQENKEAEERRRAKGY